MLPTMPTTGKTALVKALLQSLGKTEADLFKLDEEDKNPPAKGSFEYRFAKLQEFRALNLYVKQEIYHDLGTALLGVVQVDLWLVS
jgi:MoxR-like ATPase